MSEKTFVYLSKSMIEVVERTQKLAGKNQPILVTGETGAGKDLIASMIHETSSNAGAFVAVNCAAIPANLWESEIFGHVKGAFTDAKTDRPGKIEQAGSGTLFFDEIGEMPLEMQPKMLRLLQEKQYQRVGGNKDLRAECRFIFATNRDLGEMQSKGLFRPDLFYRINVFQIKVPPLRERRADVPALARHFLEKYCSEMSYPERRLSDQALDAMVRFDWPGNVRELENCVIQSIVNAQSDVIGPEDLPPYLSDGRRGKRNEDQISMPTEKVMSNEWNGRTLEELLNDQARRIIIAALEKTSGNKVDAAKLLGLKRATFYNRLKELGL